VRLQDVFIINVFVRLYSSPGFGLCLRAETTDEHCVYVAEAMSRPRGSTDPPSARVYSEFIVEWG
jgi:hypothetical protein